MFPRKAGVGDALAVLQLASRLVILISILEEGLQHHTGDRRAARCDLPGDVSSHRGLLRVVLVAVGVATWGVLVFVLPWKHFSAAGLRGEQGAIMWWALILGLMLPWFWILQAFARALFEFSSDSKWSMKYEEERKGRRERIRKKREAYEQERGW